MYLQYYDKYAVNCHWCDIYGIIDKYKSLYFATYISYS